MELPISQWYRIELAIRKIHMILKCDKTDLCLDIIIKEARPKLNTTSESLENKSSYLTNNRGYGYFSDGIGVES